MQPIENNSRLGFFVVVSPDGKHVIHGSADNTICIKNMESCKTVMHPLEGHTDGIHSIAISSDGSRIVSGFMDNSVRIWELDIDNAYFCVDGSASIGSSTEARASGTASNLHSCDPANLQIALHTPNGEDGWVCGANGELVTWVPGKFRTGFWTSHTSLILRAPTWRVDLSSSVHGTEWMKCYTPQRPR